MIDPVEKSTEVPAAGYPGTGAGASATSAEVAPGVRLDSRLGLVHEEEGWLAVSDLHYGYEVSRRRDGGLWPLWGMETIERRLRSLIEDWKPARVVLVGDVVDSSAAEDEAVAWLECLLDIGPDIILVEGNHDRGAVRRHFSFVPRFETRRFLFHHGHQNLDEPVSERIVVTGHLHPSTSFHDGAGTRLRLPTFTREIPTRETPAPGSAERWTLPAFSPWAGGNPLRPADPVSDFRRWVCGGGRVFEID